MGMQDPTKGIVDINGIDFDHGKHKVVDGAQFDSVVLNDQKTTTRITLKSGFDWKKSIGDTLPGHPTWCPARHFGYLERGTIKVNYEDGSSAVVNTNAVYKIPAGHIIEVVGEDDAVMVRGRGTRSALSLSQ
eukprot:1184599-Prorocentrum_minimum.AAC.13